MPKDKKSERDLEACKAIESMNPENQLSVEMIALLDSVLEKKAPEYTYPMVAPWKEFPDLDRYSIGWRMGSGEDYKNHFEKWFIGLSDNDRDNYLRHNIEPDQWVGYFEWLIKN